MQHQSHTLLIDCQWTTREQSRAWIQTAFASAPFFRYGTSIILSIHGDSVGFSAATDSPSTSFCSQDLRRVSSVKSWVLSDMDSVPRGLEKRLTNGVLGDAKHGALTRIALEMAAQRYISSMSRQRIAGGTKPWRARCLPAGCYIASQMSCRLAADSNRWIVIGPELVTDAARIAEERGDYVEVMKTWDFSTVHWSAVCFGGFTHH